MGTEVHLVAVGAGPGALDGARRRVAALERRWSRFLAASDVSRMNRAAGVAVAVSPATVTLLELALDGWRLTGGRFDPTVLPALLSAGYDRTFAEVAASPGEPGPAVPAAGCDGIVVDELGSRVTLPPGLGIDLGGIAKGHTADLVVEELLAAGARGALANLGGDVRAEGEPPDGRDAWTVAVADPFDAARDVATVRLAGGAVVTTSRTRRRWGIHGAHHLIDPATGAPAEGGVAAVTVVAGTGAWAEVLAKAAFVAGAGRAAGVVRDGGATGIVVDGAGRVEHLAGMEALAA